METTMYEDDRANRSLNNSLKNIKSNMTLDFAGSKSRKQFVAGQLLSSPDLGLLKLASPELERMIIQQNGMVTTTPTPTQFLFPKDVSEEQEAYARGFVDALNELHSRQPNAKDAATALVTLPSEVSAAPPSQLASSTSYTMLTTVTAPNVNAVSQSQASFATTASLPNTVMTSESLLPLPMMDRSHFPKKEEDPQTVPCLTQSPPLSPINMESQERKKLERKRARNRVAARKCRTRKLERISRLEDRVSDMKTQNSDLTHTATSLREQVFKLKQQIMEHVNSGCHVMLSPNLM